MGDRTVIPLRPRVRRASSPGVLGEAAAVARGLLLGLALVAVGAFLVAMALVLAVVGSPVIAVVVAWLLLRHPRPTREPTARRLRVASA